MHPIPELIFIDLDGTVYPNNNGLWDLMSANIERYMVDNLGITLKDVKPLRSRLYQTYGTTLHGLQSEFEIDPQDYLNTIHAFRAEDFIPRNDKLRVVLSSIPQPKWIFTNSDRPHAERVLKAAGIEDQFEGIIDVIAMDFIPKPDERVYHRALQLAGHDNHSTTLFIEDSLKNLMTAERLGWQTAWISEEAANGLVDFVAPSIELLEPSTWGVTHER